MFELSPDAVVPSSHLAELLAPTLGWEKSSEVVESAALRLGFPPQELRKEQALAVLDELARTPGMVGIAARFARSRLDARGSAEASPSAEPVSRRAPRPRPDEPGAAHGPVSSRSVVTTVSAHDVAALLSNALGMDKALELVAAAAARLGLPSDRLDKGAAIALLDQLAAEPGVVGLCARFGKARLILRFAA
jgi:hypothetical protein